MSKLLPDSTPIDDLEAGRRYQFSYDNGSIVRGELGMILSIRGRPLRLLVPFPARKEVLSVPVERLIRISPI